eukprot:4621016-Prymnesium_polylepis.1
MAHVASPTAVPPMRSVRVRESLAGLIKSKTTSWTLSAVRPTPVPSRGVEQPSTNVVTAAE